MANPSYDQTKENFRGLVKQNGPGRYATAITPSDTAAVAIGPGGCYAKKLYIGVAGNVTIIAAADQTNNGLGTPVLFTAHPVGYMDMQVRAVMATGTAATGIVGYCD